MKAVGVKQLKARRRLEDVEILIADSRLQAAAGA
jgi:hypothetical protein